MRYEDSPDSSLDGVVHQHGDSHGTHPARDGSQGGGHLEHLWEGHVPHQAGAGLLARVGQAIDAAVNDDGTRLDPISLHHLRGPSGHNENVSSATHLRQVVSPWGEKYITRDNQPE